MSDDIQRLRDRATLADELVLQEREIAALLTAAGFPDTGRVPSVVDQVRKALDEIGRLRAELDSLRADIESAAIEADLLT